MTESEVAAVCDQRARELGYEVESYSDSREVRTHPGLPDRRYIHRGRGVRLWVELKAPKGQLTLEQHKWLIAELEAGGLATVIDDVAQLQALFELLTRRMGTADAMRRCTELVALTAKRGYRRKAA